MLGNHSRPQIPLPKQWSNRVRSGVLHAISLAHFSLTSTRSWAVNSWNARVRLKAENERLRQELALLQEEMRIKDSRMLRIPAQRRPHYPPVERLAILELRAARGWTGSQTARNLLVTTATVCSWMSRLDEDGPRAIVQIRQPVNEFPDFVTYLVQRLKVLCPSMGKVKIAQVLGRAGLHLGSTTVQRMLTSKPRPRPTPVSSPFTRVVTAKRPNHVWHCDLSAPCGAHDLLYRPFRPRSASGRRGFRSRFLRDGRSVGGLRWPSITTRGTSWDSPCSTNSRLPWQSGHSLDELSGKPEPLPGT